MRERPLVFGAKPSLVGVMTEPSPRRTPGARPACILINAGLVHRVGPNRLHVEVARHLAARGYPAFRLDLSGRGDSEVRRDGLSFVESAPVEIQAAMNHLQQTAGIGRFVLMGICSGAINSVQTALVDARVDGCIAIDPPAYPTTGYYLRRYVSRLFNAESWRNTVAGRNTLGRRLRFRSNGGQEPRAAAAEEFGEPFEDRPARPGRQEAADLLSTITGRGARMLFVFSGSWSAYNYRNQFRDAFPQVVATGQVEVEYYPDSDHTFSSLYNQQRLIDRITRWFQANWPDDSVSDDELGQAG